MRGENRNLADMERVKDGSEQARFDVSHDLHTALWLRAGKSDSVENRFILQVCSKEDVDIMASR